MLRKFAKRGFAAALVLSSAISLTASGSFVFFDIPAFAEIIDDAADLQTQQQQEKNELNDMKSEMDSIRGKMSDSLNEMGKVQKMMSAENVKEFRLQAKETVWETFRACSVNALTYNNQLPGPVIRVSEGDRVSIVLHNTLKSPTSLYFHGMHLPYKVNGLPRQGAGVVGPGESFTYQFVADQPGTYWYHPQAMHLNQMNKGLSGVIIVEPKNIPKTYERDQVIVISEVNGSASAAAPGQPRLTGNLFLVNGKSAQAIPPLELRNGERMRLRMINSSSEACPFSLTGHKFEIVAQNGSDGTEPHVYRDTVTLNPGERMDLEFTADNPGVWSLSSLKPSQCQFNGAFPGGFAMVVRYPDALR